MADRTIMNAKDAVSASLAECFVTIGDNRYNFMQAINLEANFEKNKTEVPILGKTGKGNKATGWKGTGSATFHYNTSIFRELMKRYKDTCLLYTSPSPRDISGSHFFRGPSDRDPEGLQYGWRLACQV